MWTGTVSETVLKRSVLKKIKYKSRALIQGPDVGVRCSRLSVENPQQMVFAAVTVSGCPEIVPMKAFYRMVNDISASGGRLTGMLITLFFSESDGESGLKQMMDELAELAHTYEVDILGGHTEMVSNAEEPVLSLTGVGAADTGVDVSDGKLMPGQDIVMTKWAGATGAAALVRWDRSQGQKSALSARFSEYFLDQAAGCFQYMSSEREAQAARKAGATALYNVGENGLFGALWEMAARSGVGLCVDLKRIPICQETVEVCEFFDCNPYMIPSDGVLLVGTKEGEQFVEALARDGIPAAVIGTVAEGRDRVVVNGEEKRFLVPPGSGSVN